MNLGVALGRLNPHFFEEVVLEADRLGYESVWLPEHLVFPMHMTRSPLPGEEHPPVPPQTPVFDCFAYLSYLAGRTSHVRLGTHVYNLALRHPFVAARAVQTLDIVSGGRALVGIGAGWLESEWLAAGLDFHSRGPRLDEAIGVCRRLWTEPVIEHHGRFFDFDAVAFEPKPVQRPCPPLLIGGESNAALRRAARLGDGWVAMSHTPESAAAPIARLNALRAEHGRADLAFSVTVGADVNDSADLDRWRDAGADRLIVAPWARSKEAVDGLRKLADLIGLTGADQR
ncbi:MAG TPA: LLM class F420-dependent oxidoreductase [Acidimicrobiales bacterium]|nr:LLM class F420-dependent oxidoreductase [Acidimicrobiales bacterium]